MALMTSVTTHGFAQKQAPDAGQSLEDTLDLGLREGLEQYLERDIKPDYLTERKDWKRFSENRHYMPYKNLRSTDPMPMMAIDDSTRYTLVIKKYPNYYKPDSSDPGRYRKFLPEMKP
jgi:hypothetical protein